MHLLRKKSTYQLSAKNSLRYYTLSEKYFVAFINFAVSILWPSQLVKDVTNENFDINSISETLPFSIYFCVLKNLCIHLGHFHKLATVHYLFFFEFLLAGHKIMACLNIWPTETMTLSLAFSFEHFM